MTGKATTLEEMTEKAGIAFSAAFVHGVLSAYACKDSQDNRWVTLLITDTTPDDSQKQAFNALASQQKTLAKQLADSQFSYALPSPEKEGIRAQSLLTRDWASGFWLAAEHSHLLKQVSDKASLTFFADLKRIAAMPIISENNQDNHADLLEIQEYCRMGAIGLFLSVNQAHHNG